MNARIINLVPAYPLDGGRIARAIVWRASGDRVKGTRYAARLGEGFAYLLGALGVYVMARSPGFDGLWLMILAFMIWQSARVALQGTQVARRVQGVRVADIMDHEPISVRGTATVAQALDESFYRYNLAWLPVIDGDGRFIGIARRDPAQDAVNAGNGDYTVGTIIDHDEAADVQISENRPLTDALTVEALVRLGALVVVDPDGLLKGVVTLDQVRRVVQTVMTAPAAR